MYEHLMRTITVKLSTEAKNKWSDKTNHSFKVHDSKLSLQSNCSIFYLTFRLLDECKIYHCFYEEWTFFVESSKYLLNNINFDFGHVKSLTQ